MKAMFRTRRWVMIFGLCLCSGLPASHAQQVTPVVTETAKLFDATILRLGHFGRALACAGEMLVVGAPYDDSGTEYTDGAVSLFERVGTSWHLQQKLYLKNGWPNDSFGVAVALADDTLVVGARGGDLRGGASTQTDSNEGLAVVYTRSNGQWRQTQVLSASDSLPDDYFGTYVALQGNTLVIGNSAPTLERRGAYVFTRDGASWRQVQKLNGIGPAAVWGDTLAFRVQTGLEQHAVQIYTRQGNAWARRQELTGDPSTNAFSTSFGGALALSETHLAVGAASESDSATESYEGKVYVFARSGTGWVRQQKLAASDARARDQFGAAVALSGETLAVGTVYLSESTRQTAGAAYLFKHSGNGWTEQQKLQPSDGLKGERFGQSVALSERVLLVGAHLHGRRSVIEIPGAAYAFEVAPTRNVINVSAASYAGHSLAPASIATAFGSGLATATQSAAGATLPETLAGTSVKLTDSAGNARLARLFFVSPTQLNYQVPPDVASGAARVTVTNSNGVSATAQLQIEAVAPGLFTADASGRGLAAAVALRVKADGAQSYEPIARYDTAQNKFVAVPLEVNHPGEQVFLLLFGTGLRLHGGLNGVRATAGGTALAVDFAGAQGSLVGLDQVNLRLPPSLAGRGEVEVTLTVNGKLANPVRIFIR